MTTPRRPFLRSFALLALLLLGTGLSVPRPARAAVDVTDETCPVDGSRVPVTVLLSSNAFLGHDRDLCPHAAGGDDEIRAAVSACGACGFAGTQAEFRAGLPDAVAARVKKELRGTGTAPGGLPPWERYANRARILEWGDAPPARVGESWLRAAWSVRLEDRPLGGDLATAARRIAEGMREAIDADRADPLLGPSRALEARIGAKKGGLPEQDVALAWYLAGSGWRARGELDAADERYAKALAAAPGTPLGASVEAAIAADRASMELERSYLKKALGFFRAALAEGEEVPASQRTLLAFLAGECARRTGGFEEAERWYRIAETLADKPATGPAPRGGIENERARIKDLVRQGIADARAARGKANAGKPAAPKTPKTR